MFARLCIALTSAVLLVVLTIGAALAAPPIGGGTQHPHHVVTGNGGCIDINAVLFNAEDRGLHQGATSSGGNGLWHGPCPQAE
jgi:hypothetical protein